MPVSLYRPNGPQLVSAETAKQIALMVTRDVYGKLEAERNLPLTVSAEGENWLVKGTHSKDFNAAHPPDPEWRGPLVMIISGIDGRILEYVFIPMLPWALRARRDFEPVTGYEEPNP